MEPPPPISVLFCNPSAAALTQSQFSPNSTRRKSHLPDFSKTCLVLGRLSLFLPFFSFSSSFLFAVRKLAILSLHFFPPTPSSVLHVLLLILFLPLLFLPLLLNSPPFKWFFTGSWVLFLAVCFRCTKGPHLGCFHQRFLGPYPGCFLFAFFVQRKELSHPISIHNSDKSHKD